MRLSSATFFSSSAVGEGALERVGGGEEGVVDHRRSTSPSPVAANPWLERRVLNYAHQGGAREAPSSTLFAMRQAVDDGAHALELDVHATR